MCLFLIAQAHFHFPTLKDTISLVFGKECLGVHLLLIRNEGEVPPNSIAHGMNSPIKYASRHLHTGFHLNSRSHLTASGSLGVVIVAFTCSFLDWAITCLQV